MRVEAFALLERDHEFDLATLRHAIAVGIAEYLDHLPAPSYGRLMFSPVWAFHRLLNTSHSASSRLLKIGPFSIFNGSARTEGISPSTHSWNGLRQTKMTCLPAGSYRN